jgi:nucleotide-binding universal stress UspA family protein
MYERILAPVDGSEASTLGLREAIELSKDQGATLRLVHVVDELILSGGVGGAVAYEGNLIETLRDGGRNILATARALVEKHGATCESAMLEHFGGPAADLIVEDANKWKADLIVLGTHGRRGIRRVVMGSDAEQIVRASPVPVLLVRLQTSKAR